MSENAGVVVEVDHNRYLPDGGRRVDAIVSVTATEEAVSATADGLEMIIIDCSGSMQGERIRSAREACVAAVDQIRDGVRFAVIAGAQDARVVYPPDGDPVVAHESSRAAAVAEIGGLSAGGGTHFAAWLQLAREIAERYPDAIRHAILLTDGQNTFSRDRLGEEIEACAGVFTVDCRGVGTDWKVDELSRIAEALLGTVDIVAEPGGLADDFRQIIRAAMGKRRADVRLRLTTPRDASVLVVKQLSPTIVDLTGRRTDVDPMRGDYPLGTWGAETRDYHVAVALPAQPVGSEVRAALAGVLDASDGVLGTGRVVVEWTADRALGTVIDPKVAAYTGQVELAGAVEDGIAAYRAGDRDRAEQRLGDAVRLAGETGHDETARLLAPLVEVDPATGTVRLRPEPDEAAVMTAELRSRRTVPVWERA